MPSKLLISDTTVTVTEPANSGDSCEWNGECVLSGNAKVTYISQNNYSPLKMGVKNGDNTHSLTLKDKAELHCLHQNPDEESQFFVSGLELFQGDLTLEGNSLLEAQGRPATDPNLNGSAIVASENCDILVKDSAEIKAAAPGVAISMFGNLTVSGGTVTAESKGSNGIYAGGAITITNGAEVKASGYWPAIFAKDKITIDGSTAEAKSEADVGIYSKKGDIEIKNSIVKANAAENYDGILAGGNVTVEGSWIETSGDETYGKDSVRFNGKDGTVVGNAKLPGDVTVEDGMTLTIPKDASLSVGQGNTLTNRGGIKRNGALTKDGGEIICVKHFGNAVWTFDDKTHTKTWDCCGLVEVQGEEHEMNGGVCAKCGYRVNQSVYPDYDEPTVKPSQTEAPVQNNPSQDDDLKAPKTGESSLMMLYALLLMSGAAAVIAVKKLAK